MNQLTLTLSMASLLAISGSVFAERPDTGQKRERFRSAQGTDRPANPRADRVDRGQAGQLDPAITVERLMKQFDADGDAKLDMGELTKLMTAMRDRRQSGSMRGRESDAGGREKRPSQNRNRPNPSGGDQGGDRPARPSAE